MLWVKVSPGKHKTLKETDKPPSLPGIWRLSNDYQLVVLDEVNIAIKHGFIDIDTVIKDLLGRPETQHVVLTGRAVRKEIIDIADTVTEMKDVKYAFRSGIKAQKGIEL